MSVNFLASKNFFKGSCKVLIFKKKIRGCSREIDLMKKGLRRRRGAGFLGGGYSRN